MVRRLRGAATVIIFIMISSFILFPRASMDPIPMETICEESADSTYIMHDPIIIDSNDDFETQGWPGQGTEEAPYIIQGLNITAETCISISHTSVHAVICDCVLKPTKTSYPEGSGVHIYNLSHVAVESCSLIVEMCSGVTIDQSENCSINGNSMNVCKEGQGVYVYSSSFCEISNNRMQTKGWAIFMQFSSDLLICNNTMSSDPYGVRTSYPWNGICSVGSDNITIHENTIHNGGFLFMGLANDWVTSFQNNTVNGKPVGYFANEKMGDIDGSLYGQVILANCTDMHVVGGAFEQTAVGVQLGWCTNCVVDQVETMSTVRGTSLENCQNCTIRQNVHMNCRRGVIIQNSNICCVIDFSISHCRYGLGLVDSSMCNVTSGEIFCNSFGIRLENENNETEGINRFWNNSIGWNVYNARDDVDSTLWDDGVAHGNSWSDYQQDGKYQVLGEGNNTDRFPSLFTDTISPQIDSPSDIEYDEGITNRVVTWNPTDEYPYRYDIYKDQELIDTDYWIGTSISFDVGGYSAGVYNITIVVFDGDGNFAFDTIIVNSRGNSSSTTFTHGLIDIETILVILGVIGIAIIIFLVKRKSE